MKRLTLIAGLCLLTELAVAAPLTVPVLRKYEPITYKNQ